jgi:hypothetical protein
MQNNDPSARGKLAEASGRSGWLGPDPPMQLEGERRANKRKQIQIKKVKLLAYANVYFSESGLFNRLQPTQIRKTPRPVLVV